jgi:DNA polymerase II small subunit/DNA polymerase delta subunit B
MPGNHDAVRLMEPQLPLPDKVIKNFGDNLTFTANPVLLN